MNEATLDNQNNGPPGRFPWRAELRSEADSAARIEAVIDDPNFKAIWWLRKAIAARLRVSHGLSFPMHQRLDF